MTAHFINQCVITRDDERAEWVCHDELTGEGWRTSNLETAKEWCWWSPDQRRAHYAALASALYDAMERTDD